MWQSFFYDSTYFLEIGMSGAAVKYVFSICIVKALQANALFDINYKYKIKM